MYCYPNWTFLGMFLCFIIFIVPMSHLDYYAVATKVVCQEDRIFFNSSQFLKHNKKPEECLLNPQLVGIWNSSGIAPSHWEAAALCSHHLEKFLQALCQIWDCDLLSKPEMSISVRRNSDQSNGIALGKLRQQCYFQEYITHNLRNWTCCTRVRNIGNLLMRISSVLSPSTGISLPTIAFAFAY